MAYLVMQNLSTTKIKYPVHSCDGYCHVLVTRHVVWIDNWIYWTLITCNYNIICLINLHTRNTAHTKYSVF
jgi:hypothetical protein